MTDQLAGTAPTVERPAAIDRSEIDAIYPPTPLQHSMLLASRLAPGSGVYVVQLHLDLCGELDVDALRASWSDTVERHDVHRTLFVRLDEAKPLQLVRRTAQMPWQDLDWSGADPQRHEELFADLLAADRAEDFDPSVAPLMRVTLVRLAPDRHRLLWTRHHAVSDGWSMPIVVGDVLSGYRARTAGRPVTVVPAPRYRDYVSWLAGRDTAEQEAFWRAELAGVTGPTPLTVDRPPAGDAGRTATVRSRRVLLDTATTEALTAAAREARLTPNTLVLGAWAILLRRYSGEHDVVTGAVVSGRPPTLDGADATAGCFVTSLPVRAVVDDDADPVAWLADLQAAQVRREEHGHVGLGTLRGWAGLPGDVPLFESLVVFENFPLGQTADLDHQPVRVENAGMAEQTSFPLTLTVAPGERMSLQLAYDTDRFDDAAVDRMLGHYRALLVGLAHPARTVGGLTMLSEGELAELDALSAACPEVAGEAAAVAGVHRRVAAQAGRSPDADALVAGDEVLSYAELDRRAAALAARLVAAGVRTGSLVGVCLERTARLPVAMLAVLRTGAAYLPLDPDYPAARIAQILHDARPRAVLVQESTRRVVDGPAEVLDVDAPASHGSGAPDVAVEPEDTAVVIYTSGSTGRPKGVRLTHGTITALLDWARGEFTPRELAGTLASTSICFDLSIFELFVPLDSGATVVLVPNVLLLGSSAGRERVTLVNTVPSAMDALLTAGGLPASVRSVNLAGEALAGDLVDRLHAGDPDRVVRNLYGPSEDTVYSTWARVPRGPGKPLIGRPVTGTTAHVLDGRGDRVPIGVPGELHLGGAGVSPGYHDRPGTTADRFGPDPFAATPGARLYRTGDLVVRHPDGQLEYLGRNDRQVKLRGFRIELGEIEIALRAHGSVTDAVVVVRDDGGTRRLVGYVTGSGADPDTLGDHLRGLLPHYMVPSATVVLEAIPLTPNGKVDWSALPSPVRPTGRPVHRRPSGATEQVIAEAWTAVLGLADPGADDGFFAVGGDSLTLAQVFGRLRRNFPSRLVITDLFAHRTIAALARHIDTPSTDGPSPSAAGPARGIDRARDRVERRRSARERSAR